MYTVTRLPTSLNMKTYERQYERRPLIFSSAIITTVLMKLTYIMGTSFTKLRLLFHSLLYYRQTFFPPLCEMLYAGHIKLFAEVSELCTHTAFHPVIREIVSLEYLFRWPKRWKPEGAISILKGR